MKLRVGLVGLGEGWQHRYLPALRALADRFEVRAVCEQVGHRAQTAAAEFNAQSVDGFHALAAREDIDAVVMLAPQWYGPLPILAACDRGKAVYVGHSLYLEPDQVQTIRKRVESAGVVFMVERLRRHCPATLRLKELIATRLGCPRLVFCHHRLPGAEPREHAAGQPSCWILHELVELVDWCRFVIGREPRWVTGVAHGMSDRAGGNYQMISLDFSDNGPGTGPLAQISCGQYLPADWQEAISYRLEAGLQVCCEHGIAFVDVPATVVWFDQAGRHQESLEGERPVRESLLAQFHRAVTAPGRPCSDLEDTCRALAVVQQAQQSFRRGRRLACG